MGLRIWIALTSMEEIHFKVKGEFIELNKLLKACSLVATGGEAGAAVEEGLVFVNGEVTNRKRHKIFPGMKVAFNECVICVE